LAHECSRAALTARSLFVAAQLLITLLGAACSGGSRPPYDAEVTAAADGPAIVFVTAHRDGEGFGVFQYSTATRKAVPLVTLEHGRAFQVVAAPDGRAVAVLTQEDQRFRIAVFRSDGELLATIDDPVVAYSGAGPFFDWSPDGSLFAASRVDASGNLFVEILESGTWSSVTPPELNNTALAEQYWLSAHWARINYTYDTGCVVGSSGGAYYWWRSSTGWSLQWNQAFLYRTPYGWCVPTSDNPNRSRSAHTVVDSNFKNGVFCAGVDTWVYYRGVTVAGFYDGHSDGWVDSTWVEEPAGCPPLHWRQQLRDGVW